MGISAESTTNCRLIDSAALGAEERLRPSVKALLDIMGQAGGDRLSARPLPQYQLSRLLWATQARRLTPQRISVYVAAIDGLYRFNADTCFLEHAVRSDVRAAVGVCSHAPISLLYVAELDGLPGPEAGQQALRAAIGAGQCSQNVTLMCAAEGLATQVRAIDEPGVLAHVMALRASQRLLLAQAVGWPAGAADGAG